MAYISSIANRWYCALESAYGELAAVTAANRIPAVTMAAQQQRHKTQRKDKTGSRTYPGTPAGTPLQTSFSMTSYVRDWTDMTVLPSQGPLVQAAMGAAGVLWPGNTTAAGSTSTQIVFASAHELNAGQAITSAGEIRFVTSVVDSQTVTVNAPFAIAPAAGAAIGQTATYSLATELPSVSVYDYWDPSTAVQRAFSGAAVDKMSIQLNGDFHQFAFSGVAQDILDSASFTAGQGGAALFPDEPAQSGFAYTPVPGNLGQVWLGAGSNQFLTVENASIQIQNDLDTRSKEFGSVLPRAIVPGMRTVTVTLELLGQDDAATTALYQAARTQTPIPVMFQIGQTAGHLLGIYMKSLVPGVPAFDDGDKRLVWKFSDTRAQGTAEDEMVVAFG
jgi:hypothetical protein